MSLTIATRTDVCTTYVRLRQPLYFLNSLYKVLSSSNTNSVALIDDRWITTLISNNCVSMSAPLGPLPRSLQHASFLPYRPTRGLGTVVSNLPQRSRQRRPDCHRFVERFCRATAALLIIAVVRWLSGCLSRSCVVSKRQKIQPWSILKANRKPCPSVRITILNDLEWPLSYISRFQRHTCTRGLSATAELLVYTES